jgi:AraC family transcriptional regulator
MKATDSKQVYRRRINRVIDHIQGHLSEPLPLERLARLAHFSPFHFHRIFRSLVGEPLHTFVRRLRLERALFQMAHGPKATLTEIALRCGFASSTDFSRAFKQVYGFSPRHYSRTRFLEHSKIRQDLLANAGYNLGALPNPANPDRFRVRLVDRPAQRIAFVRVIGGYDADKIMGGFNRLMAWGTRHGLVPGAELIGMSLDDPDITPMKKYRFDWCLALPPHLEPDGEASLGRIPAGRFAAIHCHGDIYKVDRAWRHLFNAWLPRSSYQPTHEPALEVFRGHPVEVGWETFDIDCYLPVKPLRKS